MFGKDDSSMSDAEDFPKFSCEKPANIEYLDSSTPSTSTSSSARTPHEQVTMSKHYDREICH